MVTEGAPVPVGVTWLAERNVKTVAVDAKVVAEIVSDLFGTAMGALLSAIDVLGEIHESLVCLACDDLVTAADWTRELLVEARDDQNWKSIVRSESYPMVFEYFPWLNGSLNFAGPSCFDQQRGNHVQRTNCAVNSEKKY